MHGNSEVGHSPCDGDGAATYSVMVGGSVRARLACWGFTNTISFVRCRLFSACGTTSRLGFQPEIPPAVVVCAGDRRLAQDRIQVSIDLHVICVLVVRQAMSTYEVFQRYGVHSKDDFPENGALQDSTPQRVRVRHAVAHLHAEVAPSQIGPEPLQRHPFTPYIACRRVTNLVWSTVSTAADRSIMASIMARLLSTAEAMSFCTRINAVTAQ